MNYRRNKRKKGFINKRALKQSDLSKLAASYDKLGRAQYVAGRLGMRPPSSGRFLRGKESDLIAAGVDPRYAEEWVSNSNKNFFGQSAAQIWRRMGSGTHRGIDALDVMNALVSGLSPITGAPRRGGFPFPYELGKKARESNSSFSVGMTAKTVGDYAKKLANDVARSTAETELTDSHSVELGESESREQLIDMIGDEGLDSDLGTKVIFDIFNDPRNVRMLAEEIQSQLPPNKEKLKRLWGIVAEDIDLLLVDAGGNRAKIGIKEHDLARRYNALYPDLNPESALSLGKYWRNNQEYIYRILEKALSSGVMKDIKMNLDIQDVIREERRRRYAKEMEEQQVGMVMLKDGTRMPVRVLLRGYLEGIEMARKDKDVRREYGKDKEGNPVQVMDKIYSAVQGWLRKADREFDYELSAGQKKWLNGALGGTRGILGPYLKMAIRYHCMRDGVCNLRTLPKEDDFRFMAHRVAKMHIARGGVPRDILKELSSLEDLEQDLSDTVEDFEVTYQTTL